MEAIVLAIGDELVLGQTVDTNSAQVSTALVGLGIATSCHQTVPDCRESIARAITTAAGQADLVIITGGLGPTEDDLTRQGLADALGVPLVEDAPSLETLAEFFASRGRPMPDRNKIQAMHPQGTQMLANSCGTAPGIRAALGNATIYVMPGVPIEMKAMLNLTIIPDIDAMSPRHDALLTTKINTFGSGESSVAEMLGDMMDRKHNPTLGTTVADGIVAVRVRSHFEDARKAQSELEDAAARVEKRLGPIAFGRDDQTIQQAVIAALQQTHRTVATAESCTGGLIGKMLTDVAGASSVYLGGWVTYSNELKTSQLGIDPAMLQEYGAVSEPIACAMASGALERSSADLAVAITGVAGPDGATTDKPVGTVWIALAQHGQSEAHLLPLHGSRALIRNRAAKYALQMLRFKLLDLPLDSLDVINLNQPA